MFLHLSQWISNYHGQSKVKQIVFFAYENLPIFCFRCGILGHHVGKCQRLPSESGRDRYSTRNRGGPSHTRNMSVSHYDSQTLLGFASDSHDQTKTMPEAAGSGTLDKEYVDIDHLAAIDPVIAKALWIIHQQIAIMNEIGVSGSHGTMAGGLLQNVVQGEGLAKSGEAGYLNTFKIQRIMDFDPIHRRAKDKEIIHAGNTMHHADLGIGDDAQMDCPPRFEHVHPTTNVKLDLAYSESGRHGEQLLHYERDRATSRQQREYESENHNDTRKTPLLAGKKEAKKLEHSNGTSQVNLGADCAMGAGQKRPQVEP